MRFRNKRGAATDAAAFIAIMTVVIILYILFLPPDVRQQLLGDSGTGTTTNTTGTIGSNNVILQQQVGRVNFVNTNQKSFDIPTVRISSPTAATLIKSVPSLVIRNGIFDKDQSSFSADFQIDRQNTKNVILSFNVKEYTGPLTITLNGREIFSDVITSTNPPPISLDPSLLSSQNTLVFSVPSPGIYFWNINTYTLENVQIIGDVTNLQNSVATQYFTLTDAEKNNLDSVKLYFVPICTLANVGSLSVQINGMSVYNGVADCGTKSFAVLNNDNLIAGSNQVTFSTQQGSYVLDNINVQVTLKDIAYKSYFFDLPESYFTAKPTTARCGDYDGVCPPGCSAITDADCCFKQANFWCALPTSNPNDRCVSYVDQTDCGLCLTGYYDSSGIAPTTCQDKCGDNKDNQCLGNCNQPSQYYDKDCCFASNPNNFWCQEVPVTGLTDKCTASVVASQCSLCPSGYVNSNGASPSACSNSQFQYSNPDTQLLSAYQVKLTVTFLDDTTRHRVDLNINGHRISIDTYDITYTDVIDPYVRQGTNSIEIVPVQDQDIAEIKVEVIQVASLN